MKSLALITAFVALTVLPLAAAPFEIAAGDSMTHILNRQMGETVELRLRSGDKIGGVIAFVGANVVHLKTLTGQEFFEAAVSIADVSAVVVRAKK
jgi:hypothetical protein